MIDTRDGAVPEFLARLGRVRTKLAPYTAPHRRLMWRASAASVMVVLCRLAIPWPLRGLLGITLNEHHHRSWTWSPGFIDPVLWLGLSFVGLVLLQGAAEYLQRVLFTRYSAFVVEGARRRALKRLTSAVRNSRPVGEPGDVVTRVVGDASRLRAGLKGTLIHITQNATFFFAVSLILLAIDFRIGLVMLLAGADIAAVSIVGAAKVARLSRRFRKREGELAQQLHEAIVNGEVSDALRKRAKRRTSAKASAARVQSITTWIVHGILAIATVIALALGVHDVRTGTLDSGGMFLVIAYMTMIHNRTVRVARQVTRLGTVIASAERLTKAAKPPRPAPEQEPSREAV